MNKSFVSCGVVLAAMLCLASSAHAEKAPNPAYEVWSKFKVGATVKHATDTMAGTNNIKSTITVKLVELTPEKAVIETVISMNMSGRAMDMPPQKRDIPAQIDKPADPGAAADAPKSVTGEEDVKVGDKTYKTKWTDVTATQNGMTVHAKTWTSDQVPGGVVKMTSTTEGTMASSTKMDLIEVTEGK